MLESAVSETRKGDFRHAGLPYASQTLVGRLVDNLALPPFQGDESVYRAADMRQLDLFHFFARRSGLLRRLLEGADSENGQCREVAVILNPPGVGSIGGRPTPGSRRAFHEQHLASCTQCPDRPMRSLTRCKPGNELTVQADGLRQQLACGGRPANIHACNLRQDGLALPGPLEVRMPFFATGKG